MTGRTFGPYEILSKLGEGGMGAIYRAHDTRLDRDVALKILPAGLASDSDRRLRFEREAQATARLNHPHIVTIYDIVEAPGEDGDPVHLIVMEYLSGETLSDAIRRGLDTPRILRLARQIASGLAAAHQAGIVHRDLKPANIMVSPESQAKILDFGIARFVEVQDAATATSAATQMGAVLGTASYMSPEQAAGRMIDARSDIFSFGVVLYEMLAGVRPFIAESPLATIAAILYREPPPLAGVAAPIAEIALRCLRKDPEERFQTMEEVRTAIEGAGTALTTGTVTLAASPAPAPRIPSIAVLPFVNMNRDEENEFFCDGLTEELINSLSQLHHLRVVSRSTVFQFKGSSMGVREIGEKLQVTTALEGSVRRAGNRLRITAQLVNPADGMQIWSQRFDREMKDIFEVQDEVTGAIIQHLRVSLSTSEMEIPVAHEVCACACPEGYELYLKGRYFQHWTTVEGFRKALACFEQAVALDPRNAKAYAGISGVLTYTCITGLARPHELMPRAKAAAMKALEIDESLAEANSALGLVHLWYDWDWEAAEHRLRRATRLSPGSPDVHANLALLLTRLGRREEALASAKRAVESDPLSLHPRLAMADALLLGRYAPGEVIAECERAIDLAPQALWPYWFLLLGQVLAGDVTKVDGILARARGVSNGEPISEGNFAWALARAGREQEARLAIEQFKTRRRSQHHPAVTIAWIYTGLREIEHAIDWLETGYEERDPLLTVCYVNPAQDVLRTNPRFQALVRRMNFPAPAAVR